MVLVGLPVWVLVMCEFKPSQDHHSFFEQEFYQCCLIPAEPLQQLSSRLSTLTARVPGFDPQSWHTWYVFCTCMQICICIICICIRNMYIHTYMYVCAVRPIKMVPVDRCIKKGSFGFLSLTLVVMVFIGNEVSRVVNKVHLISVSVKYWLIPRHRLENWLFDFEGLTTDQHNKGHVGSKMCLKCKLRGE